MIQPENNNNSVGLVRDYDFVFGDNEDDALPLDCGKKLKNIAGILKKIPYTYCKI